MGSITYYFLRMLGGVIILEDAIRLDEGRLR